MTKEVSIIGDRFLICRPLGTGGMSIVQLAFDIEEYRFAAVKCLFVELTEFEDYLLRFIREGQIYRRLNHPHIVALLDAQMSGRRPFVALEYVAGQDSSKCIEDAKALPILRCLRYFIDLSEALMEIHRKSIIHRDIKPSNVIIDQDDCVKLIDFGIAHARDGLLETRTGVQMGTRCYAAPEQNQGREVDDRADLYSLAATMWELLTGKRLFDVTGYRSIVEQQLRMCFPPPSKYNAEIPPRLDELILKLLSTNPEDRPSSAKVLRDEVSSIRRSLIAGRHPNKEEIQFECYHLALERFFASDFSAARSILETQSKKLDNSRIQALLGKIAWKKREKLKSLGHLKAAIELNPEDMLLRADYVRILLCFSMFNQAMEAVEEGLKVRKDDVILESLRYVMQVGRFDLRRPFAIKKFTEGEGTNDEEGMTRGNAKAEKLASTHKRVSPALEEVFRAMHSISFDSEGKHTKTLFWSLSTLAPLLFLTSFSIDTWGEQILEILALAFVYLAIGAACFDVYLDMDCQTLGLNSNTGSPGLEDLLVFLLIWPLALPLSLILKWL